LAYGEDIAFYKELERRGKETPLSKLPELDIVGKYYLNIVMRLRKIAFPITLQDLAAYCSMFPVSDKVRLLDVVARVNRLEKDSG